jgi:SH3-like domain-containing protein
MFRHIISILAIAMMTAPIAALAQETPPYWASLRADKVRMRTGPGRQFPATWLYQRSGLPVKVVEVYPHWRRIVDPDGTTGWVQGNLLSEVRTAIVTGGLRELRATADDRAVVTWRAEAGVVGKLSQCARGWCLFETGGRRGYISTAHIWGVGTSERFP